jgi:hypothetical protein
MPVFDFLTPFLLTLEKSAYWLGLNDRGGQIRPGVLSGKQSSQLNGQRVPGWRIGK